MKLQQFLEHHHIGRNPFADEDAQTDLVFKEHCIDSTYHPTWDKVYGDPSEPSTSIVFGEKGSGKTAMCLQIARHLEQYNREHPGQKIYIIQYDDFNPFLDRFSTRVKHRRADRVLQQWRLWDHMDAILALGVTGLIDRLLEVRQPSPHVIADIAPSDIDHLDRNQARDLLLLAACYDQSTAETFTGRWHRLRKRLRFWSPWAYADLAIGVGWSVLVLIVVLVLLASGWADWLKPLWVWLLVAAAGWVPWLWRWWKSHELASAIVRHVRTTNRDVASLRKVLKHFSRAELSGQPLPTKSRTDDRYELLNKFQGILHTLGFRGIIVLVDRVDEPHLINGSAELMKLLVWPMLDNKFLKHPGMGIKLMLPIELMRFIEREDRDFYQRARLDKQNLVPCFQWTGQALLDVTNARIQACAIDGASPTIRDLMDDGISDQRLLDAFRSLRVPRHLFKFMYRLLVSHCNAYTDRDPVWKIDPRTFEAELALFTRDLDAYERGVGAV